MWPLGLRDLQGLSFCGLMARRLPRQLDQILDLFGKEGSTALLFQGKNPDESCSSCGYSKCIVWIRKMTLLNCFSQVMTMPCYEIKAHNKQIIYQ